MNGITDLLQPDHYTGGGAVVVSLRQAWLRGQLTRVGVDCRFLLIQGQERGHILPPLRPPLVLDTVGMEP